jgi:hypothetical protein
MTEVSAWIENPSPDGPLSVVVDLINGEMDRWVFRLGDPVPGDEDSIDPGELAWVVMRPDGSSEVRPAMAGTLRERIERITIELLGPAIAEEAMAELDRLLEEEPR